ncbi:MAG: FtsW/RodA/SpoVE family cell cycle protein [Clostridia bacterium]|nr:FtsW/RodA/SpoVE family cell cycle protein [Clostridia bacterium]
MKEFSVSFKEKMKSIDFVVLFSVLGMNILSLIILASAANEIGSRYLLVQTIASVLGIFLMFTISFLDYDKIIKKYGVWIFAVCVLFMITVVLFGEGDQGNKAWLRIPGFPFDIQPSEYCKFLFIITFASHIKRVKDNINHPKNVISLALHAGIICGLVLMTGDLGSTLVYFGIVGIMLLVGGLSVWYFIGVAAVIVIASPVLWNSLSELRQQRIICGFNPELDPLGYGFQALGSRSAIAAGGFLGSGFFGGIVYPTIHSNFADFIFATLAEKFGFFGCFAYMTLMGILIVRLLWIARIARKDYGAYMCMGVVAILVFQTLENIGMCLAMLPVVGITLPFLSYGGSSVLAMYMLVGLIQSIKSHNRKYFFEREKA